ncbi:glycosyltransferase family 4 protein [Rathayibacter sp. VKM Ac-2805]|uniref:glycosyltransferase family 4 protein n=1 Tax=Rathayibacter sp. VKM Ac-2805 TaxID=2609258 RepID=UPI001FC9714F|nr:glycosyltransferase family 4 protein [Rathayibacter sp. VKM Ac-2805]
MTAGPGDPAAGLRIAMLAPVAWRTPPRHYGPWEQVASLLTEGLVRRGVDVTLFATGDSVTTAALESVTPTGYAESGRDGRVWEALHIAAVLDRAREFDLVHNHLDWLPLALSAQWPVPLVTTVHGFSGPEILPAYREALRHPRTAHLVSISDSDRSPELDYAATVHHGIDVDGFPAGSGGEDLVILGRIHPDKGTAEAIRIAAAAGRRLLLCGIVQDERYWREEVEPLVDGTRVVYRGSVGPEERALVLGGALALLHPIGFDEPFGLSVVEAMACGTPVIAYRRGSMAEIIDEGVTGYAVGSLSEAVAAVERVGLLDRAAVRETARRRFAVDRMVDEYLAVYAGVLGR